LVYHLSVTMKEMPMAATKLDELAARGEELLAGLARMRNDGDAIGRSLTALEQTKVELRQDLTRLRKRVDGQEPRLDGLKARLERIELRLGEPRWTMAKTDEAPIGTSKFG
jgi:predicted nuclease with TOPRIM domain